MQIVDIDFCTNEDLEAILEIERTCFKHPWEMRVIEYDLDNQGSIVYLKATLKDIIAGCAVLSRGDDVCHLMSIAVLPEYRNMGIALQLLLGAEEVAHEWGNKRMRLEVRNSNKKARDLYSDLGFTYNSRMKGYYPDGEDALVLTVKLPFEMS